MLSKPMNSALQPLSAIRRTFSSFLTAASEQDQLAERAKLGEDLVHGTKAHGGAVRRRHAAKLTRVRAAAHRLHDLKRDVPLGPEQVPASVRLAGETRQGTSVDRLELT